MNKYYFWAVKTFANTNFRCLQNYMLKTLDTIMGFSVHLHYFITSCSDTNYLHIQILKNPAKLIAIMNADVFIYGVLKLLSRN